MLHVGRHRHDLGVPLLHQPGVYEGPMFKVDIGKESSILIPPSHVELETDGLASHQLSVGLRCLLTIGLHPFGGVVGLRGVDPDVPDTLPLASNAADFDGVAVDDTNDPDQGRGLSIDTVMSG